MPDLILNLILDFSALLFLSSYTFHYIHNRNKDIDEQSVKISVRIITIFFMPYILYLGRTVEKSINFGTVFILVIGLYLCFVIAKYTLFPYFYYVRWNKECGDMLSMMRKYHATSTVLQDESQEKLASETEKAND